MSPPPPSSAATKWDAFTVLARWAVGLVFIYMGASKALDPENFLKLLRQYDLLHNPLVMNATAGALPWFEIFCGLLLVGGIAVRGTAFLLAAMLAVFTFAVWRRALQMEAALAVPFCSLKFDCGCGGGVERICLKLPENIALFLLSVTLLAERGKAFCLRYSLFLPPRAR